MSNTMTLTLSEAQVQAVLNALAEVPLKTGIDAFLAVNNQVNQQRQQQQFSQPESSDDA